MTTTIPAGPSHILTILGPSGLATGVSPAPALCTGGVESSTALTGVVPRLASGGTWMKDCLCAGIPCCRTERAANWGFKGLTSGDGTS